MVENLRCTLKRSVMAPGAAFSAVCDSKFKRNRISVNLVLPLDEKTVSDNAVVPFVLKRGKNFKELNLKLSEMYGADLYAEAGAFGKYQTLSLSLTGISDRFALGGEKLSEMSAQLLAELLFEPNIADDSFGEKDVEIEKNNLIKAIEAEINEKRSYAIGRCKGLIFAGEPYGIKKYGTVELAEKITAKSAAEAYARVIKNAAIEILFIGDGDAEGVKCVFEEKLRAVERCPIEMEYASRKAPEREVLELTEEMEINQGKLVMAWRTNDSDSKEKRVAIQMMNAVFGMTPFSKLFVNVREKQSLCYYCAARFDKKTNVLLVDSGIEFENVEKAKAGIIAQLDDMKKGSFSEEDIEHAKLYMKNAYRSVGDSLGGLEGWYLSQILCGESSSPEEETAFIDRVTKEDMVRAAESFTLDAVYFLKGKDVMGDE